MRPVYVGENPYKGTYKRNHEGDMDDIDKETLRKYRQIFEIRNEGHVWNPLDDKTFLEKLGGYRKNRRTGVEGLTLAGLMMFGTGQAIREEFSNVFMDYRNETEVTVDVRWNDRITYDGTWENNLFNFFTKVTPKLTEDLPKPFKLEGIQRIDETPVHKAVREAFVNLIIHADYLMDAGTLKIIKKNKSFEFTNPGILKLPIEDIFRGGNSKPRNPHMQTMLRMVGFGDNAGSGFPTILATWEEEGWIQPELVENTTLNQVTLVLQMKKEAVVEETDNLAQNNERSLSEVLSEVLVKKNFDKILPIIKVLEKKGSITPKEAEEVCGKSAATVRRYLSLLTATKIVIPEGNTNNSIYRVAENTQLF